jgi:hypothetical protein
MGSKQQRTSQQDIRSYRTGSYEGFLPILLQWSQVVFRTPDQLAQAMPKPSSTEKGTEFSCKVCNSSLAESSLDSWSWGNFLESEVLYCFESIFKMTIHWRKLKTDSVCRLITQLQCYSYSGSKSFFVVHFEPENIEMDRTWASQVPISTGFGSHPGGQGFGSAFAGLLRRLQA